MLEEKGWTAKLHQKGGRGFPHLSRCSPALADVRGPSRTGNHWGDHWRPTFTGSTSQAGHPEGTRWALSTRPGAVGTSENSHVLAPTSATDSHPGDGDTCENTMLLSKRSILVPVLREGREGRGGPFLCNGRACLVFVMLRGELLFAQNHM